MPHEACRVPSNCLENLSLRVSFSSYDLSIGETPPRAHEVLPNCLAAKVPSMKPRQPRLLGWPPEELHKSSILVEEHRGCVYSDRPGDPTEPHIGVESICL